MNHQPPEPIHGFSTNGIPDLSKLSALQHLLDDVRRSMPEGTTAVEVIWINPDGSMSWHGNMDLYNQIMAGQVMSAKAMQSVIGGGPADS